MNFSQITLKNEEGVDVLYDVLLNFTSEEFNKSFIIICPADREADDNGQISVTPLSYTADEDGNITGIQEIQTREEFELVKREFENMMHADHDHECGCGHDHGDDHECCGGHGHGDHGCGCGHNHE
jgi:uncharacterized protein YrzB (UPF0473 family)